MFMLSLDVEPGWQSTIHGYYSSLTRQDEQAGNKGKGGGGQKKQMH